MAEKNDKKFSKLIGFILRPTQQGADEVRGMMNKKKNTGSKRFKPVPKVKGTKVPKKYVSGSKNKRVRMSELLSTAQQYKDGTLTPEEMDRSQRLEQRTKHNGSSGKI